MFACCEVTEIDDGPDFIYLTPQVACMHARKEILLLRRVALVRFAVYGSMRCVPRNCDEGRNGTKSATFICDKHLTTGNRAGCRRLMSVRSIDT